MNNFGVEQKLSDSCLQLVTPFSGDDANNETNLTTFLQEMYNMSQTNNLTETTTILIN